MSLYTDIKLAREKVEAAQRELRRLLMVAVIDRDKSTLCHYCQTPTLLTRLGHPQRRTVDHVIPQSFGGKDELDNLVLACQSCNARKSNQVSVSLLCPACRGTAVEAR